jgi:large subunit ribosomal protein L28
MALCEICGKKATIGNKVSHANNKTKRFFNANVQKINIIDGKTKRKAYVCTKCIKSNKVTKVV